MNTPTTDDRMDKERRDKELKKKALNYARERMKSQGYIYPVQGEKSGAEYLDEISAYSQRESSYMMEFLRSPSGPRPIISHPPREDWQNKYDN